MTRNEERATRVERALAAYGKKNGEACPLTNARDFIADILHFIHFNGGDAELQAEIAIRNYRAERKG